MVRRFSALLALLAAGALFAARPGSTIEYPAPGTLFPPDIAAPTFLWHDATAATTWRVRVTFPAGLPLIRTTAAPRLHVGPIDPDCISTTNRPPEVDSTLRTWRPSDADWAVIKGRSATAVTITGLAQGRAVSRATVHIGISTDPVGAPIFYRDVPLMPSETEPGIIKPLAPYAVRMVQWRLRDISRPSSRVVMESLPVCANCHSFSADGRRLGMDLDGLHNNKGRYFIAPIDGRATVRRQDVIQWHSAEGRLQNAIRVGFMSQLSPDGRTVVTTIDTPGNTSSNYYVANFTDYRFLQVFFPTRGQLAWYRADTGILAPLPGADDPAFVHFGAVWSLAGDYLVFCRARAREPNPPGLPPARHANDERELQIQYDLYRIPFNHGRGGRAEPIPGASANGMSNSFPKISPDGRWLIWVQSRNGQLMRPDSQLWIVPVAGGTPRRLRANTSRMNSWHSFSPNGRWLVFSSKARSPYTQMYLTHIDAEGNDTPPVLIENSTAANRAVNLPEFVNLPATGLESIDGPALDYYRLYDRALYFEKQKRYADSADRWKQLLAIAPEDAEARRHLATTLLLAGRTDQAKPYLETTRPVSPEQQQAEAAATPAQALAHWRELLQKEPNNPTALRRAAWILATNEQFHNGPEAQSLAVRALLQLRGAPPPAELQEVLAAAYAENGRYEEAIATLRRAQKADPARSARLETQIRRYETRTPWRE